MNKINHTNDTLKSFDYIVEYENDPQFGIIIRRNDTIGRKMYSFINILI